jgi:hypothetical protein
MFSQLQYETVPLACKLAISAGCLTRKSRTVGPSFHFGRDVAVPQGGIILPGVSGVPFRDEEICIRLPTRTATSTTQGFSRLGRHLVSQQP